MDKKVSLAVGCLLGLSCTWAEHPGLMLSDPEARAIYSDLISSSFLPEEPPRSDGLGLSETQSRVWIALQALDGCPAAERDRCRVQLSHALATTGFTAQVCFRTPSNGARIHLRLVSSSKAGILGYTNDPDAYAITLGIYDLWTERNGEITDLREHFSIARRRLRIDFEGHTAQDCRGWDKPL